MPMKKETGITLIALVITIIVLLILAGVSIAMLTGDNGILTQANNAKTENRGGTVQEIVDLWKLENKTNEYVGGTSETEEELLRRMIKDKQVLEDEIDRGQKTITIGKRVISYAIEENLARKKNRVYGENYCKKILALANNPDITDGAEKYRKYFDDLRVKDNEDTLIIHAKAVSNYINAYSRNPALRDRFIEILKTLTYKGEISQENYTPRVQAEYMKNAGLFMWAYVKNPALLPAFIDVIDNYNPYVTAEFQEGSILAGITYNQNLEEVKAAREEILGDRIMAYSRNPSLRESCIQQFNKLVEIGKNENPSAKEQAGAVNGIGKTIWGYARNPSLREQLFEYLETEGSLIKDEKLEEVQVARAETLEMLISTIYKNPTLSEEIVNYYNQYIGLPPEKASPKVQAISLYNSGNLLEVLINNNNETNANVLKNYEKVNINITANTDEIQAASLANLGKLYWTLPFAEETKRTSMLEFFRTKLYKEITSNSPIIQAAKYYSDGYYDSAEQEIMKIGDKAVRTEKLKILEDIKKEFSPNIDIDYSLDEVQIAKIEFFNTIYDSYYTEIGGRYFNQEFKTYEDGRRLLQPSEEYFARK